VSDDGADMGITAERALKTVLGGEESPTKEEGMTPAEMRDNLLSVGENPESYDDGARKAGKIILQYLILHPEDCELTAESEYIYPEGSFESMESMLRDRVLVRLGIDDAMKEKEPALREQMSGMGLTGFMYGWAVNAAKYSLGLPPVPNPAIVTVGGGQ
jgi:hypothetical protein